MDNDTASIIVVIFSTLSTVSSLLLIIGLFKPSLVIRRPSWQTRKGVFLVWGLITVISAGGGFLIAGISENPPETSVQETSTLYVKEGGANVRECPSTSCKVISTLPQNTWFNFTGDSYDKYPDWVAVTLEDGRGGYVSKSTLSSEVSELPQPKENGIRLAKWNFDPLEIGTSYDIYFCLPVSARSGATCGGLAGDTETPVGGSPPYSFVKSSGFLPPGMSLELNGLLSGSPTTEGTYNFKICAKDLSMNEGCENFTLVVRESTENIPIEEMPISISVTEDNATPSFTFISGRCGQKYYDQTYLMPVRFDGVYYEADVSGPVETLFETSWEKVTDCGSWTKFDIDKCGREKGQSPTTHVSAFGEGPIYPPGYKSLGHIYTGGSFPEIHKEFFIPCQ